MFNHSSASQTAPDMKNERGDRDDDETSNFSSSVEMDVGGSVKHNSTPKAIGSLFTDHMRAKQHPEQTYERQTTAGHLRFQNTEEDLSGFEAKVSHLHRELADHVSQMVIF